MTNIGSVASYAYIPLPGGVPPSKYNFPTPHKAKWASDFVKVEGQPQEVGYLLFISLE